VAGSYDPPHPPSPLSPLSNRDKLYKLIYVNQDQIKEGYIMPEGKQMRKVIILNLMVFLIIGLVMWYTVWIHSQATGEGLDVEVNDETVLEIGDGINSEKIKAHATAPIPTTGKYFCLDAVDTSLATQGDGIVFDTANGSVYTALTAFNPTCTKSFAHTVYFQINASDISDVEFSKINLFWDSSSAGVDHGDISIDLIAWDDTDANVIYTGSVDDIQTVNLYDWDEYSEGTISKDITLAGLIGLNSIATNTLEDTIILRVSISHIEDAGDADVSQVGAIHTIGLSFDSPVSSGGISVFSLDTLAVINYAVATLLFTISAIMTSSFGLGDLWPKPKGNGRRRD